MTAHRSSRLLGLLAGVLVALPILLGLAVGFGSPASAALLSCAKAASDPTDSLTIEGLTATATWHLGSATKTVDINSQPAGYDIDDDGDLDVNIAFDLALGTAVDVTGQTVLLPIQKFVGSPADALLRSQRGIDYGASLTAPAPPLTQLVYLAGEVTDLTSDHSLPAGTVGITMTASYSDQTKTDFVFDLDTTGSSGTGSPWAPDTKVSALVDDGAIHDGLAVSAETKDAAGHPQATSDLATDLTVDEDATHVDPDPSHNRDKHARLAMTGPLASDSAGPTSVGMPGAMALAIANQCTSLPVESWVGLQFSGPTGLRPKAVNVAASEFGAGDVDKNGTLDPATERTLDLEGHIDTPPATLTLTSGANEADVDGNGTLDGFDLRTLPGGSGGGGPIPLDDDRLPWQYVSVHHDGAAATPPHVQLVFGQQAPGTSTPDLYLAVDATDLPTDTAFDRAGIPGGVDADGDGVLDDINGDSVVDERYIRANDAVGSLAFCARDRATFPGSCAGAVGTAGRIKASFQDELPRLDRHGNLPVVGHQFASAPTDITATKAGHFTPAPGSWAVVNAERTADQAVEVTDATLDVTGLQQATWDLRRSTTVDVQTSGLGQFGVQAGLTDVRSATSDSVWSVLADAPDDVSLTVDQDGAVSWDLHGQRTAVALGFDVVVPGDDNRVLAGSAWVGTGNGATDGLVAGVTLTADLVGPTKSIALDEPDLGCPPSPPGPPGPGAGCMEPDVVDDMALDVGFSTRTATQGRAGLVTRGHVRARVDDHLTVTWIEDGSTLVAADLATRAPTVPCSVRDLAGTVVTTDGPVVTGGSATDPLPHDTLTGVAMLPVPPGPSGTAPPAFPTLDVPTATDFAHVVVHEDPRQTINGTPSAPAGPVDDRDEWGVDLRLTRLDHAHLGRGLLPGPHGPLFAQTDACVDGRTTARFELGFYEDTGAGSPATWFSGAVTATSDLASRPDAVLPFDHAFEWNTPVTGDDDATSPSAARPAAIGDLTDDQVAEVQQYPDATDLFQQLPGGCGGALDATPTELTGQLRRGTEAAVAQILGLGSQSRNNEGKGIPVPTADGFDGAVYATTIDPSATDASRDALDAGFRLDVPADLHVRQPLVRQCGVGNQPAATCHPLPRYDATETTTASFQLDSNAQLPLGDFDIEYLTEPLAPPVDTTQPGCLVTRLDDPCALRTAFHLDTLPGQLALDATIQRRPRDGFLDVDASLTNTRGQQFGGASFEQRDDYRPATLLDPSEAGSVTNQPLASLVLQHVGSTFHVATTVWAPVYGYRGPAYTTHDCTTDWPHGIGADHVYPHDDDPSTWPTLGPRPADQLRPPYVHGRVDLDPDGDGTSAQTIDLQVDSRVDHPGGGYDHGPDGVVNDWYDDPPRDASKIQIDSAGVPTDGELWGLEPGLQEHEVIQQTFGKFETCIDGDVPVHADWTAVSRVELAFDLLKATLSIHDLDQIAGGDAHLAVEERSTPDFVTTPPAIVTGAFMHELKTWLRVPVAKDWATREVDERTSVGIIDGGAIDQPVSVHDGFGIQSAVASHWTRTGDDGGSYYVEALAQVLFAEPVEQQMSADSGWNDLLDSWIALWSKLDHRTDRITYVDPPALAPGTVKADGKFHFETAKECATDERNASWQSFVPNVVTSDGSTFELSVRWNNDRAEVILIGRYSSGDVRYVRELYDADPGTKTCKVGFDGSFTIDADTGRTQLDLQLSATTKDPTALTDWTPFFDDQFVFDASGNGWLTPSTAELPDATVGQPVEITPGLTPAAEEPCVWYPGDGTRILPGDADDLGTSATHTYAFAGTYQVMEVCYSTDHPGPTENQTDPFQGDVREWTITVR